MSFSTLCLSYTCSLVTYYVVFSTACVDGEVILFDGLVISTSLREGTVLVCYNNSYGTVCDDRWDSIEASIVCGQLGYNGSGMWGVLVFQNIAVSDIEQSVSIIAIVRIH